MEGAILSKGCKNGIEAINLRGAFQEVFSSTKFLMYVAAPLEFLLLVSFFEISTWKNTISTYTNEFSWTKWPKFTRFWGIKSHPTNFLW